MTKLTEAEISQQLSSLPDWQYSSGEITRSFEFKDFSAAFAFVTQVALRAEAAGHHPDIDIRYDKVRLGLVSHDSGGVTARDIKFAKAIDHMWP